MLRRLRIALAVSVLAAGCAAESPTPPALDPTPDYEVIPCPDAVAADDETECGVLRVPENRSDADSPTIEIAAFVLAATGANPAPDAFVYLEGGPGGPGWPSVRDFTEGSLADIRATRDIVVVDQRGTGYSEPALLCPDAVGDDPAALRDCHDRLGAEVDLASYNSAESAADVAELREALEYEEWNLFGVSYGSRLALTVLRDHPEGIRSVVLDSVFPLEVNGFSDSPISLLWGLDVLARNCSDDGDCRRAFPDLREDLARAVIALEDEPYAPDSDDDKVIDGLAFIELLTSDLGDPDLALLAGAVAAGDRGLLGEYGLFFSPGFSKAGAPSTAGPGRGGDEDREREATGLFWSVVCAEERPFVDDRAFDDTDTPWPSELEEIVSPAGEHTVCEDWNVPAADAIENDPVTSTVPALVLAGALDVTTPPQWARRAASSLPASVYVEFPGLGHGVIGQDRCVADIIIAFLDTLPDRPDSSCAAALPAVRYNVD